MFKKTNFRVNIDEFIARIRDKYGDVCTVPILPCTIGRNVCGDCRTPVLEFRAFTTPYCDNALRTTYASDGGIVRVLINNHPTAWNYAGGVQDIRIAIPPNAREVKAVFKTWIPKYPSAPTRLNEVDISQLVRCVYEHSTRKRPDSCWNHLDSASMHIEYRSIKFKLQPCLVFTGFTGRGHYADTIHTKYTGNTCTLTVNKNNIAWPPWGGPHENIIPLRKGTGIVNARYAYWKPRFAQHEKAIKQRAK